MLARRSFSEGGSNDGDIPDILDFHFIYRRKMPVICGHPLGDLVN
jgi:hypothetical protein